MSQPSTEARIANLEKQAISLGARIEELSSDTAENFRDLKQDVNTKFTEIKQELKKVSEAFVIIAKDANHIKNRQDERFDSLESRLNQIEKTMATKDDISRIESTLTEILDRLPPKQ